VKLESVDVAQLEHPLDPEISAKNRDSVSMGADLSQRDAQLSQGAGVDVIDSA
jgi:hypothetical protein